MKNSFWKSVLFTAVFWTIFMLGSKYVEYKTITLDMLWKQLPGAIILGIVCALSQKFVYLNPHKRLVFELEPHEILIKEDGTIRTTKKDRLEGKLGLTDKRIIFKGDRYDTRKIQLAFDLENIRNLRAVSPWMIVKNEIRFDYSDGTTHRFAVDDVDSWLKAIERQRNAPQLIPQA